MPLNSHDESVCLASCAPVSSPDARVNQEPRIQNMPLSMDAYDQIARELRGKVVQMTHEAKPAHLASALSCTDIVTVAYWGTLNIDTENPLDPDRDRFILSKGHAAALLYAALTKRGFSDPETLATFNQDGGVLAEHPGPQCIPGVEAATGSLGHGLPLGIGMAMAARLQNRPYRTYVLMSDGECNEGSVWEGAMFAGKHGLDNLCIVIDYNKWQATGRSNEVLQLEDLQSKWDAFGWETYRIDGHDHKAIEEHLSLIHTGRGKPVAIVADTVKGKGVSFMEDDNNWHYRVPNAEEVAAAFEELGLT